MSSLWSQTLLLTRACLAGLPRRAATSLSMVLSIALVVAVLIGFLAMAAGLRQTLGAGGAQNVAVVLGGGTSQEIASSLPPDAVRALEAAGASAGVARDARGRLLLSREILVPVEVAAPGSVPRTVSLRGMEAAGPALRASAAIDGRVFAPGSREIVVGARLAEDLGISAPGRVLRLGSVDWTVVGIASAKGGAPESEIWGDLDAVRAVFDRQGEIQTLRARLDGPDGLARLAATLPSVSATPLAAVMEKAFLAGQSAGIERLAKLFGWPIALLMALGAGAGVLNTMMGSVSQRTPEIATLRVLGFRRRAAFAATFAEALVLSLAGALLGALASWAVLDGWRGSTLGPDDTLVAFRLAVTPAAMVEAGALALLVGALGGAFPALRAARLPLAAALRRDA